MFKILTIPVLALGLAVGGAPKPAEALTAEETAALLAGLAIVGVIASQNNNNNRARSTTRSTTTLDARRGQDFGHHHRSRILPAECLRRIETDRGIRNLAGERCLERQGVRTSRLPDNCEVLVRTNRGLREAYRQRCLERAGYKFRDRSAVRTIGRGDFDRDRDGRVILDARRHRDD